MSKWQQVKLCDIGKIITGKTPPTANPGNYGGNIPFITPSDMYGWRDIFCTERYLTEQGVHTVKNNVIPSGAVCVSCIGSDMGKVVIARKRCVTNQQINSIIVNDNFDQHFVYYLLLTQKDVIRSLGKNGTAIPILNKSKFSEIKVSVPPIEVQRKIADVLSAYDDLIENNRKQIKLLEEAAQRLYKEWFIDLRFPGHETTPIIDGIPAGWEKKTVEDFLIFHANGGWGKEAPMGKCVNIGKVIRGTDIDPIKQSGDVDNIPTRFHSDLDIKNKKLLPNDIVFELSNGNLNNIGRSLLLNDTLLEQCWMDTICASFCKLLRAKNRYHAILLFMEIQDMQSSGRMVPFKKHGANGINNFDFESFLSHHLLYTSNTDLLCRFDTIMQKIDILRLDIKNATETRNRLLPKLMTGKLEVK